MSRLLEAIDVAKASKAELSRAKDEDLLVSAWHGTNAFWAVWFCVYGVDGTVAPPTKTLGRGNMSAGFSKIDDPGLYVSASRCPGFLHYVRVDVKPSELAISAEMAERGYTDTLTTLKLGDCVIAKKLPAKRVTLVRSNNVELSREDFLKAFPDPVAYLKSLYSVNIYHRDDNVLFQRASLNFIFKELKDEIRSGMPYSEAVEFLRDAIETKTYAAWNVSEEDAKTMLDWALSKA